VPIHWADKRREQREEKLERMREQVASGQLVVRQMTPDEHSEWAARQREFDATATPEERERRESAVKKQLKRKRLQAP
jgi:hypothetical protein